MYGSPFLLRDANESGPPEERRYYLTDANYNVVMTVDDAGRGSERIFYKAYGEPECYSFGDVDGDYDVDNDDATALATIIGNSGQPYNILADLNLGGAITQGDANLHSYYLNRSGGQNVLSVDDEANDIGYAGYIWNDERAQWHVRHRELSPKLGRWLQRDPMEYRWDSNVYAYVTADPIARIDPLGMSPFPTFAHWTRILVAEVVLSEITDDLDEMIEFYVQEPSLLRGIEETTVYGSAEAHAAVLGAGYVVVSCVDENGNRQTFPYVKFCFGPAGGASVAGGVVIGMNGKNCRPDRYEGLFIELQGSVGPIGLGFDLSPEVADVGYCSGAELQGQLCVYICLGPKTTPRRPAGPKPALPPGGGVDPLRWYYDDPADKTLVS